MAFKYITKSAFARGVKACISVSLAGALFGFVVGVLSHAKGLSMPASLMMSSVMYAGAAQMVSLTMWSHSHIPTLALVATAFIVCLRYVLMGAALRPLFYKLPAWWVYPGLFFTTDESWALTMVEMRRRRPRPRQLFAFFMGASILFYIAWVLFTYLGYAFSFAINNPHALGLDFAFTGIFLALLVGLWRGKQDAVPWIVAVVVSILTAHFIPGNWYIVIGAVAGSTVGAWRELH